MFHVFYQCFWIFCRFDRPYIYIDYQIPMVFTDFSINVTRFYYYYIEMLCKYQLFSFLHFLIFCFFPFCHIVLIFHELGIEQWEAKQHFVSKLLPLYGGDYFHSQFPIRIFTVSAVIFNKFSPHIRAFRTKPIAANGSSKRDDSLWTYMKHEIWAFRFRTPPSLLDR